MKLRNSAFGGMLLLAASAYALQASAQETPPAEPAPAEAPAAPAAPAPETPAAPAAEAPAAPTAAVAGKYSPGELGKPAPGKGQVVFFRPSKFVGAAVGFKVREGGVELGKMTNGVYFVQDVDPGIHEYIVHSEVKDVTTLEVEEGEIYYLSGSISIGVVAGRPNLSPSTKEAFDAALKSMKPSKWVPETK